MKKLTSPSLVIGPKFSENTLQSPELPTSATNSSALSPKNPNLKATTPKSKTMLSPTSLTFKTFQTIATKALSTDAIEPYTILNDISSESLSTVKLAVRKSTNEKCAIKIYPKKALSDPNIRNKVMREITILKKIDHPNVVKYIEDMQDKNNFYIVTEFIRGVSLKDHVFGKAIQRLEENEAREIFSQVISALDYLHSKTVVHREVSLENIILDLNFTAKLIDFGSSTCFSNNKKSLVYCGWEGYMPPEVVNKQESYGPSVDVWSAGVLLYVMVTGKFPYFSKTDRRILDKIKKGEYVVPDYLSEACRNLIEVMLNPLPELRPNAREVLSHSWFRGFPSD